jgi:heat shock protein HtpX
MSPASVATQSVLVYNRIAFNRMRTWLLVTFAILSIVPFVAACSYTATRIAFNFVGQRTHLSRMTSDQEQEILERIDQYPEEYRYRMRAELERRIAADRAVAEKEETEDHTIRTRLMSIFSVATLGILGLVFWSVASSPTSRLLAMCGARPAGGSGAEAEAKRLLENLAIGAGLPTPKLYVIDTATPNAFAAGLDPSRSVIAVTSGILTLLEGRELEGVLAHELSHIGNRDTRLNTFVASISLFMRLPYLLRQQRRAARGQGSGAPFSVRRIRVRIFLTPIYLYLFFIAPVLATAIRAAISRSREFLADADAALLTRYPEGLMRALAKIHGCGSAVSGSNPAVSHLYFADPIDLGSVGLLSRKMLATHPSIELRVKRLMEFNGATPASVIENAVRAGKEFATAHPPIEGHNPMDGVTKSELSVVTMGNPLGRVFRVVSPGPIPLYDSADLRSRVVARVACGDLLTVFDDPGKFRQVVTHNETFGYMPLSVKLERVDMMPAEIYDPAARAAALAALPAIVPGAAGAPQPVGALGLTHQQITILIAVVGTVFIGGFLALIFFTGK